VIREIINLVPMQRSEQEHDSWSMSSGERGIIVNEEGEFPGISRVAMLTAAPLPDMAVNSISYELITLLRTSIDFEFSSRGLRFKNGIIHSIQWITIIIISKQRIK
jgi:hypothetical protein